MKQWKACLLFLLGIGILSGCGQHKAQKFVVSETAEQYREEKTVFTEEADRLSFGRTEFPYELFQEKYGRLMDYCEVENGDAYFLYQKKAEEKTEVGRYEHIVLRYRKEKTSYEELKLELPKENVEGIYASLQGRLVLAGTDKIFIYDLVREDEKNGMQIKANGLAGVLLPEEDTLICMSSRQAIYQIYDIKSGKKKGEYLNLEQLYPNADTYPYLQQSGKDILLITKEGIYEKREENWLLQVSSKGNSMYRSDFFPTKVWKGEKEDYFVKDRTGGYHYLIDETIAEAKTELKISSAVEIPFMRDMIVSYELEHPGVSIVYSYQYPKLPDNQQEINTMIQRMGAEFVSQNAADVYLLDYLSWQTYQEKGYLEALDGLAKELMESGECFENVLNACKGEEGFFVLPAYFDTNIFIYKDSLKSVSRDIFALTEYMETHSDEEGISPYTYGENPEYLVPQMYRIYGQQLYENGKVTKETVGKFLSSMEVLLKRANETMSAEKRKYLQQYTRFGTSVMDELWRMELHGEGNIIVAPWTDRNKLWMSQALHLEECEVSLGEQLLPRILFGIHTKSEKKREAEEFLQYAFSYIKEKNPYGSFAFSVFRNGPVDNINATLAHYQEEGLTEDFRIPFTIGEQEEEYPLFVSTEEEYHTRWEPLMEQPNTIGQEPELTDKLYTIFSEPAICYLKGELSLEKATDEIYSGISLWESEAKE